MINSLPVQFSSAFRGLIGVARRDITAPAGIYARSWGAATHDTAEGVHRPLTLTCLTLQAEASADPLVLIAADLGWWRSREDEWSVRGAVLEALSLDESRLMFCLSHTHAGPAIQKENAFRPGGQLIEPYQHRVRDAAVDAAREALAGRQRAILTWRYGRCDLATNRDLPEPGTDRIVCGFNPRQPADDTLLLGRVSGEAGSILATIVNYACHPTTLAWENRLLSPDFVGAMRQVVESHTDAPCLFLQGASGELAPAEQYSGDAALADRHGRRLGFAALSTLEAMQSPATALAFDSVIESGAPLAVWRQRTVQVSSIIRAQRLVVPLPLKEMPSFAELDAEWQVCGDPVLKERLWRRRAIRRVVGDGGESPVPLWIWQVGSSVLLGQPNEAYSLLQMRLRAMLAGQAVAVMNLVNGSAGYLPPEALYGKNIYQVWQTPFAAGSLERLLGAAEKALGGLELAQQMG